MAEVTVFAIPRSFDGDAGRRQRNALRSWRALGLDILLLGDDTGVAEAAGAFGARHEAELARTELGTPLISAAFERAAEAARSPFLLYANADLIFLPGIHEAAARLGWRPFLAAGRRVDLELERELEPGPAWVDAVRREAASRGVLDSPFAIDWFLFPRDVRWEMPPFAVGRPGWDNWLIARARSLRVPVVDLTRSVTVVHQRHGYGHVPQARERWEGPEGDRNRELAGDARLCVLDATHVLGPDGLRRALAPVYVRRRLFLLGRRYPPLGRAVALAARARGRRARS